MLIILIYIYVYLFEENSCLLVYLLSLVGMKVKENVLELLRV